MYNITSRMWAYLSGGTDAVANYGLKGVPSPSNIIGPRSIHMTDCDPVRKVMYVFGGSGYNGTQWGLLNDLWMYQLETRMWTWIAGTKMVNDRGVYSTLGVPSIDNVPWPRSGGSLVYHARTNRLYVLCGNTGTGMNLQYPGVLIFLSRCVE
jgi:hypothetical protein